MDEVHDAPFPGAVLVATREAVDAAYCRLAADLQVHVDGSSCVLLGVMLGGMVPLIRLAGLLKGDFILDYCHLTRYRGGLEGDEPEWLQAPRADLSGRTVLLVDDIFDEGITLACVAAKCRELGASEVVSAVLVRRRHERTRTAVTPDLVGLEVGDMYVFGCGMDYRHRWRHLSAIYALTPEAEEPV